MFAQFDTCHCGKIYLVEDLGDLAMCARCTVFATSENYFLHIPTNRWSMPAGDNGLGAEPSK